MEEKIRVVAAVIHHKTNEVEIVIEKTISAKVTMTTKRNRLSNHIEELLVNAEDPIVEKETLHSVWIDCEELSSI